MSIGVHVVVVVSASRLALPESRSTLTEKAQRT